MSNMNSSLVKLDPESSAVQTHLGIVQATIQRMAANSSACKAWCVAIVSAVLVLVSDPSKSELVWLALVPTLLFLVLDAYYLALEKLFRGSYNNFVEKLHHNELKIEDLYLVEYYGSMPVNQLKALGSFSVWGFYGALILMIILVRLLVLN